MKHLLALNYYQNQFFVNKLKHFFQ